MGKRSSFVGSRQSITNGKPGPRGPGSIYFRDLFLAAFRPFAPFCRYNWKWNRDVFPGNRHFSLDKRVIVIYPFAWCLWGRRWCFLVVRQTVFVILDS